MTANTSPDALRPWEWVICDAKRPDRIRDHGTQHTRLYARPEHIAEERLAARAYRAWTAAGTMQPLAGLVCRVRRDGDTEWKATVPGDVWLRIATLSRR